MRRLPLGVLPALDAVVAQGIADPDRIAVLGPRVRKGMAGFLPLQANFVLSTAAAQALREHGGEVSARFIVRAYQGIANEKGKRVSLLHRFDVFVRLPQLTQ